MIFRCSTVELDTESFSITRDGRPVSIAPKVFDLLVFLMRHRDRLVTRGQLLDELWPGRVVLDNVLSNDIKQARAVLGDDGVQQKYIRTVRGRGYQFVGEVVETAPDSAAPEKSEAGQATRAQAEAGQQSSPSGEASGSFNRNSIAVLPFENRSNQQDDAYFTDGFHDELLNQISRIRDLATISRTSVMVYRDSGKSMRSIGQELNSANIIEGGVQRAGDQIRINVQLIDSENDRHIWGETYTRELSAENVFAIQSEIAQAVACKLKAVLSQQEQRDIAKTPTEDLAALEAYFRGRASAILATSKGLTAAIEHFRAAIDRDPGFAEAHAQLGQALLEKVHVGGLPYREQVALAEPVIERALELNPELSEAYEALAFLEIFRADQAASEVAYRHAVELNPNNASALRAFGFFKSWQRGEPDEAYTLISRAKQLDPQNDYTLALLGQVLMELERFDESLAVLNEAISMNPNSAAAYQFLAYLYFWKLYQHDEAIKAFHKVYSLDSEVPWYALQLAFTYLELGVPDRAIYFYERFLEISHDELFSVMARLAIHRLRGENEQERQLFEKFKAEWCGREPWGRDPWVDIMLAGRDAYYGQPELAVERLESVYPQLMETDLRIDAGADLFKLALAYATSLHLCGEKDKAAPLTEKIFEALPSMKRFRWGGYGYAHAWLHAAMGNEDEAIQALRDWREAGGCEDLTQARVFTDSLLDHPGFKALNEEILDELAEQRASLARMEAAGELLPIPGATYASLRESNVT